jgi:serpin B
MKKWFMFLALAAGALAVAQTPAINPKFTEAGNRFAFKLFADLAGREPGQNQFVSPYSVSTALSMVYNGAVGPTQQAIAQALELSSFTAPSINSENLRLKTRLEGNKEAQLNVANSLWLNRSFTVKPAFVLRNRTYYRADVSSLDFSSPAATPRINAWVKEKTKGKIDQIVDDLDPQDLAVLLNAIYFKGTWATTFDASKTQDKPFYLSSGAIKATPLMQQSGEYRYLETPDLQLLRLPYKGNQAMYVFLPKGSLEGFLPNLSAENWSRWKAQMQNREGRLELPRFRMEYKVSLNKTLSALGMGIAFSGKADFSGIADKPSYISEVAHKTFVEVNEEGTEAAAVTGVTVRVTSLPTDPPFEFIADHPYFFLIRDELTGTILFMGSVWEP